MRVALLGDYPVDKNNILGGTSAVAWRLADALSRLPDTEVHALAFVEGLEAPRHEVCGRVYEHYVPSNRTLGGLTFYSVDRRRLNKVLREIKPDIIHVHGSLHYPPCVWGSGIPWVMTPHGMIAKEVKMRSTLRGKLRGPLEVWYEKRAYKVAQDIIFCNDYVLSCVRPYTRARVYKVPNALDDGYFNIPNREVPGSILFVGWLTPRKGVLYLVQAASILKERGVKFRISLVGKTVEADYHASLLDCVDKSHLHDYIEWLDTVEEQRLKDLYGECSLLVLPSLEESLPTVLVQAMAAGKPCVGANSAGIPYVIQDGKTGFLAEVGNPTSLADKIQLLLEDRELRASMGRAGREVAEAEYSAPEVARAHLEVYRKAIECWRS